MCILLLIFFQVCLRYYEHEFVELACQCPCVVVCRCSPTQKADIVKLLKMHNGKIVCAVGKYQAFLKNLFDHICVVSFD